MKFNLEKVTLRIIVMLSHKCQCSYIYNSISQNDILSKLVVQFSIFY